MLNQNVHEMLCEQLVCVVYHFLHFINVKHNACFFYLFFILFLFLFFYSYESNQKFGNQTVFLHKEGLYR
jgi:hypothetical protein